MINGHDLLKQPKWVQSHIADLEHTIKALDGLKQAHAILSENDREWFTIPNNGEQTFRLWRFSRDQTQVVCSLADGDVLLVGRATKGIPFF